MNSIEKITFIDETGKEVEALNTTNDINRFTKNYKAEIDVIVSTNKNTYLIENFRLDKLENENKELVLWVTKQN